MTRRYFHNFGVSLACFGLALFAPVVCAWFVYGAWAVLTHHPSTFCALTFAGAFGGLLMLVRRA